MILLLIVLVLLLAAFAFGRPVADLIVLVGLVLFVFWLLGGVR